MLLASPHGDTSMEVGTFTTVLSLQCFQVFDWAAVVKSEAMADAGQGREDSKRGTARRLRSLGIFRGCSQVHKELTANKNLGMAGKSSPVFDEVSHIWV